MNISPSSNPKSPLAEQPLAMVVRAEAESPPLALEPVRPADLSVTTCEAWRDECLRQGFPDLPLAELPVRLVPRFNGQSQHRCVGFNLEVTLPDGHRRQREFSSKSLAPVASRAADALIARGVLQAGQTYFYELVTHDPPPAAPQPERPAGGSCTVAVKQAPLAYLRLPLKPLLEQAIPVAVVEDGSFPVLITGEALAQAEACARRGAAAMPPVESGGLMVGSLAACEQTHEFFVLVDSILEVEEAEEKAFSISLTSTSWHRVQKIMRAKQVSWPQRFERLLGQCHGHNFAPSDGQLCEQCDQRATCSLTSVFVSASDKHWMDAVFARQPWALCHVFGLSARREPVSQLYSLRDGRWLPRGYYVLPDHNLQHLTHDACSQEERKESHE